MSRTKEIDVWVDLDQIGFDNTSWIPVSSKSKGHTDYPAKLIITLPERKIEITESQFDEAVQKSYEECGVHWAGIAGIKEKLFGKEQA